MKKVLITGFDPFGGEKINPAYEAVKLLPDEIGGAKIIKKEIPTVFQKGPDAVYEAIPEAYFTMLPVFRMVEKMKENGIPASVSYTAGTYVCNDVMYSVLHYCHTEFKDVKGGFMHVPFATEQTVNQPAGTPGMNLKDIAKAIELSVEAMLESDTDIKVVSGETH